MRWADPVEFSNSVVDDLRWTKWIPSLHCSCRLNCLTSCKIASPLLFVNSCWAYLHCSRLFRVSFRTTGIPYDFTILRGIEHHETQFACFFESIWWYDQQNCCQKHHVMRQMLTMIKWNLQRTCQLLFYSWVICGNPWPWRGKLCVGVDL